jgi:hypothetical protein
MLMAHAAWHRNLTHHGACISSDHPAPTLMSLNELLQATGLGTLKFACPDTKRGGRVPSRKSLLPKRHGHLDSRVAQLYSITAKTNFQGKNDKKTAIHIRRGDVSPLR